MSEVVCVFDWLGNMFSCFFLCVKERENDVTKEQVPKTEAPRDETESQKAGKGTSV